MLFCQINAFFLWEKKPPCKHGTICWNVIIHQENTENIAKQCSTYAGPAGGA